MVGVILHKRFSIVLGVLSLFLYLLVLFYGPLSKEEMPVYRNKNEYHWRVLMASDMSFTALLYRFWFSNEENVSRYA